MSDERSNNQQQSNQPQPNLTAAQREVAGRLGMTHQEYAKAAEKLIKSGKLRSENIP